MLFRSWSCSLLIISIDFEFRISLILALYDAPSIRMEQSLSPIKSEIFFITIKVSFSLMHLAVDTNGKSNDLDLALSIK